MRVCRSLILPATLLAALFSAGKPASADPQEDFLMASGAAYRAYKMAWFYTRTGNKDVATLELDTFRSDWSDIIVRFGKAPPGRFAADTKWRASLAAVSATAEAAARLIDAGKLRPAHKTLGAIRKELSKLRRRNGVTVFSDIVDRYGDEVRALSEFRRGLKEITPENVSRLEGFSSSMKAAIAEIRANAPPSLLRREGFRKALQGNLTSIAKLDKGIARRHLRTIRGSIASVRADFVLLFMRYG